MVLCLLPASILKQHCCSFESVHRSIKMFTYNVHKPVGPVAESPSLSLSPTVEDVIEALFVSNYEKDTQE